MSSYTTNLIPDTEQISINQITISNKLDCNSENTNLWWTFSVFKNTSLTFIAKEEFVKLLMEKRIFILLRETLVVETEK